MIERIDLVADLLMGAAHADDELDGRELKQVTTLLERALKVSQLPDWLRWRVDDFDPAGLDVAATVRKLKVAHGDRRKLLELISKVHDSDDTWDLAEDAYLHEVAQALGMRPDEYDDLVVGDLEVEVIGGAILPPPLPKS